jgi:predicted dehydrogenase
MIMKKIGIGLLGYGGIGKIHTYCYRQLPLLYPGKLPEIVLEGVCTSRAETADRAASSGGFRRGFSDLGELLQQEEVNVVDCCLPNFLHRDALIRAFEAGKHVYCEKPLALDGEEARQITAAAAEHGVQVGMTFNYRFVPALMRAKQLIDEGRLGRVYSFRAEYLHTGYQDPNRPMSWRMRKELSGGGALVDLGSHLIDLIRHLLGELAAVRGTFKTYIDQRPVGKKSRDRDEVTVDDAAWLEVRMRDGGFGTIEVSRFATGALDDLNLEIYGEKAAVMFRLMDANWLYWYDAARPGGSLGGERGWTRLETVQQYPGAALPPPRSIVGWTRTHAENQYSFLEAVSRGKASQPGALDGLRCQLIMDAAYRSAGTGSWVEVALE